MTSIPSPDKRAYEAPEWLDVDVLPAGVTDDIAAAVVELEVAAARLHDIFTRIMPTIAAYRQWSDALVAPDGVKDAIDEVTGYRRLDLLLMSVGQAASHFGEDLDMASVLTAFDRVLAGDPRSVLQVITELRA